MTFSTTLVINVIILFFSLSNAATCHCGLCDPLPWAWHGRSLNDFWGWDTHEVQSHFPDDVSGDIGGCRARRVLKTKFYQPTQTMVTTGILPFRENSHGRTENRTWDLIISSQRLWPLDHKAGQFYHTKHTHYEIFIVVELSRPVLGWNLHFTVQKLCRNWSG